MTRPAVHVGRRMLALAGAVTIHVAMAAAGGEAALKLRAQTSGTPGQTVTIDLQRWSTDEERAPLLAALATPSASDGTARGAGGRGARGGAGAPEGSAAGRGPALPGGPGPQGTAATPDSSSGQAAGAPAGGTAGRGAAAGGRGGRGRGAAPNVSPTARLAAAIKAAPTLGYVWGGVTGYSIKYAWRSSTSGRTDRLVLITDRRLDVPALPSGAVDSAAADFTVIEIRLDPKGTGEGRTSLTTTAVVDQPAGTIAVQNYDAIPLQLRITP